MKKNGRIVICFIAALLLCYFVGMLVTQQIKIHESEKTISDLKQEIADVENESKKLKKEIEHAESRETIEAIAREELGLVYPDERKFVDSNG